MFPTKEWVSMKLRGEACYLDLRAQLPGFTDATLTWFDRVMMVLWGWGWNGERIQEVVERTPDVYDESVVWTGKGVTRHNHPFKGGWYTSFLLFGHHGHILAMDNAGEAGVIILPGRRALQEGDWVEVTVRRAIR